MNLRNKNFHSWGYMPIIFKTFTAWFSTWKQRKKHQILGAAAPRSFFQNIYMMNTDAHKYFFAPILNKKCANSGNFDPYFTERFTPIFFQRILQQLTPKNSFFLNNILLKYIFFFVQIEKTHLQRTRAQKNNSVYVNLFLLLVERRKKQIVSPKKTRYKRCGTI